MPAKMITELLERSHVPFTTVPHPPAYTAQEIAASAHIPGKEMVKTVMVKIDGRMAMLVLPSTRKVVLHELREMLGSDEVTFASENEFRDLFPDCEPGAMPPFGNLYGVEVYVAPSLAEDKEIVFNAGSHTELVRVAYADFTRLANPHVLAFTT